MNKKQFLILLVIVVVLGLWGLSRWRGQNSSWSGGGTAAGQKLLRDFDVNAVAQVAIKHGTNELLLAKKNDTWRVAQRNDYPASFSEISTLLLKLKELKIVQTEQIGASQLPRLELAPSGTNTPTTVEFRDASSKALKTLTLGKTLMDNSGAGAGMDEFGGGGGFPKGRYVQVGGATDSVAVISDPLSDITPDAGHWLSKTFFKVEKPKSIAVTFAEATNSWAIARESETGEWKLIDAKGDEKLDAGKSAGVTSPFSSPSLNDVALGLTPEQAGLDKPTVIKISTFDGFDYIVNVGAKTNDNFLLTVAVAGNFPKERAAVADEKPEDKAKADKDFADKLKAHQEKLTTETAFGTWTFQVTSWTVESLLKKRNELLEEKPAAPEGGSTTNAPAPGA